MNEQNDDGTPLYNDYFQAHVVLLYNFVLETVIVKNVLQMKDLRIKVQLLIQQIHVIKM